MKYVLFLLCCVFTHPEFTLADLGTSCSSSDDVCDDVENGICDNQSKLCICLPAFKPSGGRSCTAKGLSDNCTSTADCSAVNNTLCSNDKLCDCKAGFTAEDGICVFKATNSPPGLGDACVNSSDCHDVDHAECIRDKCTCSQGYKKYGIVCITVLNSPCNIQLECSGHLDHSECDTKCVCKANFTADQNACKRGPGFAGCTSHSDCVSNALCDNRKMCICKSSHIAADGRCVDSGNGSEAASIKLVTDIVLIAIILGFIIRLF